jgi:hypothetical protein
LQHTAFFSHLGSGHINWGACRARSSRASIVLSSSLLLPSGHIIFHRASV